MRILLRVQLGKYMLSPESPEQNSYFWVAYCPIGFRSSYSTLSFLVGRISIYGGFYCGCRVCVWTVKCNRNSISWHSLSLLMTSAGKHQKLYRSGFICSGLTLLPIKVMRVGLWSQWDSMHPILRCLWPPYLSTPHTCSGDREKQGHAEKWESSKYHWRQGEGCAQCFNRSGSQSEILVSQQGWIVLELQ